MGNRLLYTWILLLALLVPLHAQVAPQDQFLQLYFSLQEAERLEQSGQLATARDRYKDVATKLDTLKKDHPEWEPSIVNFRIKFVADKISELADKTDANPTPAAPPATPAPAAPSMAPAPAPTASAPAPTAPSTFVTAPASMTPPPSGDDTAALKDRIASLEKELADTKMQLSGALAQATQLRERLDAAERELANAKSSNLEERVASIMDENNSLKAQLADAERKMKSLQDGSQADSAPLKLQLQNVQQQLATLESENQAFKSTNNDLKQQLEEAKAKLADSDRKAAQLPNADSVHRENDMLRNILTRQLQEQARRDTAKHLASDEINNLHIESKVLQQQIDILGSPIITLTPEEKGLLRVDTASVVPAASTTMEAHLDPPPAAQDPPIPTMPPPSGAPAADATNSTASPPASSDADNSKPDLSAKPKVPEEMRPLAQEAGDDFSQGKYDDAAAVYNKIIEHYPDSLYAWSNLGVVRFQQKRYPEAEKALLESIKLNPNDAFSYSILGIVYYQEGHYDDAIDKLTRASTLDPNDARTRNYLGIACSQKGWQEAAEKQLRKAIEIDPSLGDAHFNLAVIYATQKPPSRELARKHYKEALDLGIPKDPQLEKFFNDDTTPTTTPPATQATTPSAPTSTPAPAAASTPTPAPASTPAPAATASTDPSSAPMTPVTPPSAPSSDPTPAAK